LFDAVVQSLDLRIIVLLPFSSEHTRLSMARVSQTTPCLYDKPLRWPFETTFENAVLRPAPG
jgi:hypothetical protein